MNDGDQIADARAVADCWGKILAWPVHAGSGGEAGSVVCNSLSDPVDGSVTIDPTDRVAPAVATYSCDTCFALDGNVTRTCFTGPTWSGTTPTCEAVSCSNLAAPTNGVIDDGDSSCGVIAVYSCNDGCEIDMETGVGGGDERVCGSDGQWSGDAATCQGVECPAITTTMGTWTYDPTNRRYSGAGNTRATLLCNLDGLSHTGGAAEVACEANGTWSPAPATACVEL